MIYANILVIKVEILIYKKYKYFLNYYIYLKKLVCKIMPNISLLY